MFDNVKPGDKVALCYWIGPHSYWREVTVTKITQTQFVINDAYKFWKRNGHQVGSSGDWHTGFVEPLTDETRRQIAESKTRRQADQRRERDFARRRAALRVITNDALHNLDTATLERIAALIRQAQEPRPEPVADSIFHAELPDDWRIIE